MVRWLTLFLLIPLPALSQQCDTKDTASGEKMVERINRRYDDFFRYQEHLEEREHMRNKGRGENRAKLEAHEKKIEQARQEYIKNRRPKPDSSELEAKAEADKKQRSARIEVARRCYLQQRAHAEALLKRGRTIPENKEYELED
jgi:hypothetical protein